MREPQLQSQVKPRTRGHVKNQRRYISTFTKPMSPKLSRVVTLDETTPLTKSRNTSIKWSRDKSKIFYFHFHKAQGPETQQGINQNEKTPPNISCDTSTTSSRDNYPVGSINLFRFQLKLSPSDRQTSNDFDNIKNVQLT